MLIVFVVGWATGSHGGLLQNRTLSWTAGSPIERKDELQAQRQKVPTSTLSIKPRENLCAALLLLQVPVVRCAQPEHRVTCRWS